MPKLPDFEGLAMFAKVAEERSFAAAARVMGLSVATVSRGVARLEDRLGGRLINRTSRRLALTELGRTLADRATRLYTDAENAENLVRETSSQPRGVVRLAVPMSFGVRWVAPILPDFFRAYPNVSVDLHLTDDKIDLIGNGFDAAVRIAVLADSSLVARKIATVRRYILAAPSYLARYGLPQHPDDLAAHLCLGYAFRDRGDAWRFADDEGHNAVHMPVGPLRATSVEALLPTMLQGLAIGELPDFIASEHVADGRLKVILPRWRMAEGGVYFVTPTARARATKIEALSNLLIERLSHAPWLTSGS